MWKIFLIGTACIPLVCGQCETYVSCYGQTTPPTSTTAHQEQIVAPRQPSEYTNHSTTLQPQSYYPTAPMPAIQITNAVRPTTDLTSNTETATSQSFRTSASEHTVENTNVPRQPPAAASRPSSSIIFPDQFYNTEIPSESFSSKLFELMSSATTYQNLLISPMSLQTMLSFIYTISEGKLAQELANLLDLPQNHSYVAKQFQALSDRPYNSNLNNTVIMANKIYYEQRLGIVHQNIRNLAVNSFSSDVEPINFFPPRQASDVINTWISEKTHNLINNIISPNSLTPDTRAVLINSLYFKSQWQKRFSSYDTEKQQFFLSQQRNVTVDMMSIEDVFPYAEFDELKARVVELPYKLDDFRMMIILPNEIDDLSEVEQRFAKVSLKSISEKLENSEVIVKLPQFKIEFEADLVQTLQKLGLYSLFNEEAHIKLFKNQHKPLNVDQIKQKTLISVNEAGTEAAAVAFAKFVPLSIPLRIKHFSANHPFIFVIRNSKAAYFMGHVAHFNDQNQDNPI